MRNLSKKAYAFSDKRITARCSALHVRRRLTFRTFAGREMFSPTHMSPEKTNRNHFAPAGANSARLLEKPTDMRCNV